MLPRKLMYMLLGGVVALALVFGAFASFAQTGDDDDPTATPEAEAEDGDNSETTPAPNWGGRHGRRGPGGGVSDEGLAEALGITVEALEAAQAEAREAAIEQAVAEGLLTQEQADELLAGGFGFKGFGGRSGLFGSGIDVNALLAAALDISVEELQEARNEAYAARLDELVAAGSLTQEQADLMLAHREVEGYVDYDALSESVQAVYEAAIEQALADGVITDAQAEQILDTIPSLGGFSFGGRGIHRHGFGGPRGGFGPFGGFAPAPEAPAATDTGSDA